MKPNELNFQLDIAPSNTTEKAIKTISRYSEWIITREQYSYMNKGIF
jgi:hypothetical protein